MWITPSILLSVGVICAVVPMLHLTRRTLLGYLFHQFILHIHIKRRLLLLGTAIANLFAEVKRYWRSSEVAVTGDIEAGKMSDIQVGLRS